MSDLDDGLLVVKTEQEIAMEVAVSVAQAALTMYISSCCMMMTAPLAPEVLEIAGFIARHAKNEGRVG